MAMLIQRKMKGFAVALKRPKKRDEVIERGK